jgi:hypothetical protein
LYERKEKLFTARDITKWGCAKDKLEELKQFKDEILKDKNRAFAYML